MSSCTETQERIARGEALSPEAQAHLLGCAGCGGVAASYSLLDATLRELRDDVPDGFADRVVARVARDGEDAGRRLRPWLLLALPASVLVAAYNLVWFVFGTLLPAMGAGGAP
jgi:hypothetical protein